MTLTPQQADARYCWQTYLAEQSYRGPAVLTPPLEPRVAEAGWDVKAHITAVDALWRRTLQVADHRVFYAFLARSKLDPHQWLLTFRGTMNAPEWAIDCEGLMTEPGKTRLPGRQESGFWGIYATIQAIALDGSVGDLVTVVRGLVGADQLTIAGHSLGGPLATMAAYEFAKLMPGQVRLRVIASPRPGNGEFIAEVASEVPDHLHYFDVRDEVPQCPPDLPFIFEYASLPRGVPLLPTGIRVTGDRLKDWASYHHAYVYTWLMDPSYVDLAHPEPIDMPYVACIIQPGTPPTAA